MAKKDQEKKSKMEKRQLCVQANVLFKQWWLGFFDVCWSWYWLPISASHVTLIIGDMGHRTSNRPMTECPIAHTHTFGSQTLYYRFSFFHTLVKCSFIIWTRPSICVNLQHKTRMERKDFTFLFALSNAPRVNINIFLRSLKQMCDMPVSEFN